jgi:N-glycosylase/DNA lyase
LGKIDSELLRIREEAGEHIGRRIREFKALGKRGETHFDFSPFLELSFEADLFSELCFCLLTANFPVDRALYIQREIGKRGFWELSLEELEKELRKLGHRFPAQRAERILLARKKFDTLRDLMSREGDPRRIRDYITRGTGNYRVKGLGYKEASHFLRNAGFEDVAIIDRHVFRFLVRYGIGEDYKTLTPARYLLLEEKLRELSRRMGITLAEMDLLIFYHMTGKILK